MLRTSTALILLASSILLILLLSACAAKDKNDLTVFKRLDESLINSSFALDRQSKLTYALLEDKLNSSSKDKAEIWHPKAILVRKFSDSAWAYIERVKSELKNEAGLNYQEGKEVFIEDSKDVVIHLIEGHEKGNELYGKLNKYRQDVLNIDSDIKTEFGSSWAVVTWPLDSSVKQSDFNKTFFYEMPVVAALTVLSKFQNDIKLIENRITTFCNNRTYSLIEYHERYGAFAFQNSSYIRAGESVEITAGMISTTMSFQPKVIIQGKKIKIRDDGLAVHKFKASNKPGKYEIPVEISFIDLEGKKQWIYKNIEYTVVEEK